MDHEPGLKSGEETAAEWERAFREYVWPLNPRKVEFRAALDVWMGPRCRPRTQETLDAVIAWIEKMRPEWQDRVDSGEAQYVPHLRKCLHGQRWLDEDV